MDLVELKPKLGFLLILLGIVGNVCMYVPKHFYVLLKKFSLFKKLYKTLIYLYSSQVSLLL